MFLDNIDMLLSKYILVATNIKESFLLFLSNKDLYGTNPWTKTKTVNYLHGSV